MEITISQYQLKKMMFDVACMASNQTLQELGLIKTTYSRSEIEHLYGPAMFRKSKGFVKWQKKGGSRNSQVICNKNDFDLFLSKFNEELKPVK